VRQVQVDATSDRGWQTLSSVRDNALLAGKPFVVQVVQAKRTLDQNAISHAIYTQIASQLEDQTVQEVRAECKLRFGIPILRAGNPDFKAMYDKAIRATLDYEEKLKAMEFLPVTRLMDKAQFSEYLDTVIREYSKQGVSILMPGEE
jgi:hypothetical protein